MNLLFKDIMLEIYCCLRIFEKVIAKIDIKFGKNDT
jgi:hypothetical protein